MKHLLIPFTIFVAGCTGTLSASAAPQLPVPRGWSVLNQGTARGDLNGDGRPDLALAIRPHDEEQRLEAGNPLRRRLLVFFRQPDGNLRQTFANATAIRGRDEGGVMGDPFQQLRIERGALVTEHSGGSRETWDLTHRYRYEAGKWKLVGLRQSSNDRIGGESWTRDTNFNTAKVTYSLFKDEKPSRRSLLEIRAAQGGGDGSRVTLRGVGSVVARADAENLTLKVRLTQPNATLRLRDRRGNRIAAQSTRRQGEELTLVVPRSALGSFASDTTSGELNPATTAQPDAVADVTLEVVRPRQRTKRFPAQIVISPRADATIPSLPPL